MRQLNSALVGLVLALSWASTAAADGFGYPWWGWGGPVRYFPSDRQIPYFAEHPPVYYSYPVPRTYGWSPYAYPPTVMTPELPMPPLEYLNPYVDPQSQSQEVNPSKTAKASVRAKGPLWVYNPFVDGTERLAERTAK